MALFHTTVQLSTARLAGRPCILVARSYGGAVAAEAGNDPSVTTFPFGPDAHPDVSILKQAKAECEKLK